MTLIIPHAAEERMLDLILAVNMTLRLYQNDATNGLTEAQLEALTAASFTEATFTGYAAKALTGGSWTTTQADPSTGTYAQQTFTRTATGATQTIYGYTMHRTSDNVLMWFEDFAGPIATSTNGDTVVTTPTLTLDDDLEATVAARGVIASQILTADSSGYTADSTTDFALANVDVLSDRQYRIHFNSTCGVSSPPGRWILELWIDGVQSYRTADFEGTADVDSFVLTANHLWLPTTGQKDLEIRANEISGTSTLTFNGASAYPRAFWVEDAGPR